MKPNIQALLTMIRDVEEAKDFKMEQFIDNCGTVGCLVGTYAIRHKEELFPGLELKPSYDDRWSHPIFDRCHDAAMHEHLGLTELRFNWLFYGSTFIDACPTRTEIKDRELSFVSKDQALARLRKFVYYHMKRDELDEAWNARQHRRGLENRDSAIPYVAEQMQPA